MICPKCNNDVPDGTKFCPNCGNDMTGNVSQQSVNQNGNGQQSVNQNPYINGQPYNNQNMYGNQQPAKVPLGAKTWFVIVMLLVFWPVGLYCMWKYKKFPTAVRVIISVVAGFWVLMWAAAIFSDDTSTVSSNNASTPAPQTSTPAPSASSGETPYYVYSLLSEALEGEDLAFSLGTKESAFLNSHPDLFPAASADACIPYLDTTIEYKHLAKNADNYGDKIMRIDVYAKQVFESSPEETGLSMTMTEMNVVDEIGNQYYIIYLGSADVFEGDLVTVYGLPLDMSSFTNTDGGITLCPVIAGSYIQPIY